MLLHSTLLVLACAIGPTVEKVDETYLPLGLTLSATAGINGTAATRPRPRWLGQYVYAGPAATLPLTKSLSLSASLVLEFAPTTGYWGFMGTVGTSYAFLENATIDIMATAYQDSPPEFPLRTADLYVGPGAGFSFVLRHGFMLSPSLFLITDVRRPAPLLMPMFTFSAPIRFIG